MSDEVRLGVVATLATTSAQELDRGRLFVHADEDGFGNVGLRLAISTELLQSVAVSLADIRGTEIFLC